MPDGRAAYLLVRSLTPDIWIVMFDDKKGTRLSETFILEQLNNPTVQED